MLLGLGLVLLGLWLGLLGLWLGLDRPDSKARKQWCGTLVEKKVLFIHGPLLATQDPDVHQRVGRVGLANAS